jgi:hypothetical protein
MSTCTSKPVGAASAAAGRPNPPVNQSPFADAEDVVGGTPVAPPLTVGRDRRGMQTPGLEDPSLDAPDVASQASNGGRRVVAYNCPSTRSSVRVGRFSVLLGRSM